jgi:hypothetical protein
VLCRIPPRNLLDGRRSAIIRTAVSAGLLVEHWEVVTQQVLGGFADFVERQQAWLDPFLTLSARLKFVVTRWLCRWFAKQGVIDYVFIAARKQ